MPTQPTPGSAHQPDLDPHHALPATTTSEAPTGGSHLRKIIVFSVLLALIGLIVWRIVASHKEDTATNTRAAAAANRATPVLTAAVQQKTVPVYLTALGTVTAFNTVTLHSRVDGQLMQVNFHEGQEVHEHQLLLQIDPRPYKAALDQAMGTLAKDQANLKNTEAQAQRYTALYQAGVVSKEQQQAQVSSEGQAAGSIQADQAAIEAAKVNLGYTSIYSPINGIVGLRQVDPGNIVHSSDSTGLIVITQVHPISVIFTLPEDQLPQVQQAMKGGKKLDVEAWDRNNSQQIAAGTLITIDNQIDTTTGTAKLKAVFPNADNALFPNQFVNIRLIIQQKQNSIVVPTAAIQSGVNGNFVFVVHPGPTPANKRPANAGGSGGGRGKGGAGAAPADAPAAGDASAGNAGGGKNKGGDAAAGGGKNNGPAFHVDAVPVKIDFAQGASTILMPSALKAGDDVVIDGQEKLTDGSAVQPQTGNAAAAPAASGVGASPGDANGGGTKQTSTANPAMPASQPAGSNNGQSNGQNAGQDSGQGGHRHRQSATDGSTGTGGSRP